MQFCSYAQVTDYIKKYIKRSRRTSKTQKNGTFMDVCSASRGYLLELNIQCFCIVERQDSTVRAMRIVAFLSAVPKGKEKNVFSKGQFMNFLKQYGESSSFPRCCVKSNPISGNYMKNELYHSYVSLFCDIICSGKTIFFDMLQIMLRKLSLKVAEWVGVKYATKLMKNWKKLKYFYHVKKLLIEP